MSLIRMVIKIARQNPSIRKALIREIRKSAADSKGLDKLDSKSKKKVQNALKDLKDLATKAKGQKGTSKGEKGNKKNPKLDKLRKVVREILDVVPEIRLKMNGVPPKAIQGILILDDAKLEEVAEESGGIDTMVKEFTELLEMLR